MTRTCEHASRRQASCSTSARLASPKRGGWWLRAWAPYQRVARRRKYLRRLRSQHCHWRFWPVPSGCLDETRSVLPMAGTLVIQRLSSSDAGKDVKSNGKLAIEGKLNGSSSHSRGSVDGPLCSGTDRSGTTSAVQLQVSGRQLAPLQNDGIPCIQSRGSHHAPKLIFTFLAHCSAQAPY